MQVQRTDLHDHNFPSVLHVSCMLMTHLMTAFREGNHFCSG